MINSLNSSIIKWTYASAAKHFRDIAVRQGIQYYVEGDTRNTDLLAEFIEFRMDGPYTEIPAKNEQWHFFEINVLGSVKLGSRNLYRPQEVTGIIYGGFDFVIPVYKLGDESQDDGSKIGCLKQRRELDEYIAVNQFGIIREDTRITQSTVEGHYRLVLDLNLIDVSFISSSIVTANLSPSRGFNLSLQSAALVTADLTVTGV